MTIVLNLVCRSYSVQLCTNKINIYSNATIEFSNNNIVSEDLLSFLNDNYQQSVARSGIGGDDTSIIVFINNTAKNGGIMTLESINTMELSNTAYFQKQY